MEGLIWECLSEKLYAYVNSTANHKCNAETMLFHCVMARYLNGLILIQVACLNFTMQFMNTDNDYYFYVCLIFRFYSPFNPL